MSLRTLVRNATKLILMGLGGVLGAAVMVWARANSDWVTIRIPSVMVPGSGDPLEYEAKVWGMVALSFACGVLSCFWIALAVWLRAVRRERRLARALEHFEEQIRESRELYLPDAEDELALPPPARPWNDRPLSDLDDVDHDEEEDLLTGANGLPSGYDEPDDDDELDEAGDSAERERGRGSEDED